MKRFEAATEAVGKIQIFSVQVFEAAGFVTAFGFSKAFFKNKKGVMKNERLN